MARKKKEINKYEYSAKLDRVVDGDTCDALIDLGFNTFVLLLNWAVGSVPSIQMYSNLVILQNAPIYLIPLIFFLPLIQGSFLLTIQLLLWN